MIKPYHVAISRTITTVVTVDASSKQEANDLVQSYGLVEATNDYTIANEYEHTRITKVSLNRRGNK